MFASLLGPPKAEEGVVAAAMSCDDEKCDRKRKCDHRVPVTVLTGLPELKVSGCRPLGLPYVSI